MTWFYCDHCCDTIKKPKVAAHARRCRGATFTCIDCSETFDLRSVQAHTFCVTETDKYMNGATKPGGSQASEPSSSRAMKSAEIVGLEHLSVSPPWRCSLCNITCTSESTILAHAAGQKHKRKARACAAASKTHMVPENKHAMHDVVIAPVQAQDTSKTSVVSPKQENAKPHAEAEADENRIIRSKEKKRVKNEGNRNRSTTNDTRCVDGAADHITPKPCLENGKPKESVITGLASVAPVVRKLIRKHGGTMKLHQVIGAISKKQKHHLGQEADASMNQILEAIFESTGRGYDVLVVQTQVE
eukprot:jgi/Ulvmu1/10605/UM065_0061.1